MSNNDRLIIQISSNIKGKLSELSDSSSEQCIFKVHDRLRNHNKEAYEPQVLSIGPYHRGKCHLKNMETHKLRYFQELLRRRQEENADEYINALMELKDRARRCYAEKISLSEKDFVEMLCLDGIFIIEFFRKSCMPRLRNRGDKIFEMDWLINSIGRDLMLFENQIPFFVLDKLFDMTKLHLEGRSLTNLALSACEVSFDIDPSGSGILISQNEVIHLLDLRHKSLCYAMLQEISESQNDDDNDSQNDDDLQHKSWRSACDAILQKITGFKKKNPKNKLLPELKSASQLQQSGIKFERAQQHKSWLHITFENGKIKIPHLWVVDDTESIFRNLIAFEQYTTDSQSRKFVTDYARFLDNLINSSRDVEKLTDCQIITNWLGDDEVVATMFNKIFRDIIASDRTFCYRTVCKKVNKYSRKRRHIWRAHLMRNYFNTPWSIISFLAAVVLLILTLVQTIFSILAIGKN